MSFSKHSKNTSIKPSDWDLLSPFLPGEVGVGLGWVMVHFLGWIWGGSEELMTRTPIQ